MTKAFSVASWNVEHFGASSKGNPPTKPVAPIVEYVAAQDADVVAIYEVVGSVVWEAVVSAMPDHHWHLTEGEQTQEILVGVRKDLPSFFTQRLEFKSSQSTLRPGALLTVRVANVAYPLLFLHLKSLGEPKGFGLRDDQIERVFDLKRALDECAAPAPANFVFLGDLNTMGMDLTYSTKDVSAEEEIERLQRRASRRDMRLLAKSNPTYWPGSGSRYPIGNLDHVVAAQHLPMRDFGGVPVDVRGWPQEPSDAARDAWTATFSDHALLYFEVQRVPG